MREYNTSGVQQIEVQNTGNCKSKPIITIYGSGTINLSLNDTQVFVINMGNEGHITINVEEQEATKDNILKNRLIIGNYDNFMLNIGVNKISWTGSVTKIEIDNYSRWI
jgi:phage-related protein